MRKAILTGMGVGAAILGVVAYASTTNILGVGTMSYSELINGPAEVTARQFISQPGEMGGWLDAVQLLTDRRRWLGSSWCMGIKNLVARKTSSQRPLSA